MHIIKVIFSLALILNICVSCHENDDTAYFNGKIQTIEDSIKDTKKATLKILPLDGANFGWLSTYDSLMFFMNPKLPDRFYNIFNIDTGKEIGTFVIEEVVLGKLPLWVRFFISLKKKGI